MKKFNKNVLVQHMVVACAIVMVTPPVFADAVTPVNNSDLPSAPVAVEALSMVPTNDSDNSATVAQFGQQAAAFAQQQPLEQPKDALVAQAGEFSKYSAPLQQAIKSSATSKIMVAFTVDAALKADFIAALMHEKVHPQSQVGQTIFAVLSPAQLAAPLLAQHAALQSADLQQTNTDNPPIDKKNQPVLPPVVLSTDIMALSILQHLDQAKKTANIVFSPQSIAEAGLSVLLASQTPAKLQRPAWFLPALQQQGQFDQMTLHAHGTAYQSFNQLWHQNNALVHNGFKEKYSRILSGKIQSIDLQQPEQAAITINQTIAEQTKQHITQLLNASDLAQAEAVLTNAAFFKARWLSPFMDYKTTPQDFSNADKSVVKVATMTEKLPVQWAQIEGWTLVELPFSERKTRLSLLLPPAKKPLAVPSVAQLKALDGAKALQMLTLKLPKLQLSGAQVNLAQLFPKFEQWRLDALLQGQVLSHLKGIHQATIEWDEAGAEAAAATAVIAKRSLELDPDPVVLFDRPFVFLVREQEQVLFAGAVRQLAPLLIVSKPDAVLAEKSAVAEEQPAQKQLSTGVPDLAVPAASADAAIAPK